jgi:hydrogenase nickel incorporation protein HypB
MCTVCGCGQGETKIEGDHEHEHRHEDGTVHSHAHHHDGQHAHTHPHAPGGLSYAPRHHHGHEHAHAPGLTPGRMVQIEQDILAKNNAYASANRKDWKARGLFAINLVSSPGSGKTTLLVETIGKLAGRHPLAVIEGDQQTSNDAERIRATGAQAIQVNTGKGCHLDAHMVGHAFERLDLKAGRPAADRERRQPGLPGGVRPRRGAQGGDPLRHRGRGQAAQVPEHVRRQRPDAADQDRSAAAPERSTWRSASSTPAA